MNVGLHEITDRCVHRTVPRERRQAGKGLGDDADTEVAHAPGRPRVSGVDMTLVLDDKFKRGEARLESRTQALFPCPRGHGSVCTYGCTSKRS